MRMITLELRKGKRTGAVLVLPAAGILGAGYAYANFAVRKETLLALPLEPMDILLTQLYGVIVLLNLFAMIAAACILYNLEFKGNAIKKLYLLPVRVSRMYLCKFFILAAALLIAVALQSLALAEIGARTLPQGSFQLGTLLRFALYSYLTSLPVLSFMLLISSRSASMWVPLGLGAAGFLSAMALASSEVQALMLHPFVLILKPAVAMSAQPDGLAAALSLAETLLFLSAGVWISDHLRYE